MVERGGKVVVDHVETRRKSELQSLIRERVEAGSAIFSDELLSYDGLDADYRHAVINHAVEYVNGNVHTNTMENFWSLLKRGLHGTLHQRGALPPVPISGRTGFPLQQSEGHGRGTLRRRHETGCRTACDVQRTHGQDSGGWTMKPPSRKRQNRGKRIRILQGRV
jgi:hypothetical protein